MSTHRNDDDGKACIENCRNGDNDRVFDGEELESYTYSADIRTDEMSGGMEAGATINFDTPASTPNRESFPTSVEPRAFYAPGSTQVGNDSRSEDLLEECVAVTNSTINREFVHTNTRADELSDGMEAGATINFDAPASMPNRKSFPTCVEPGAFYAPGSTLVGNDSRSEDLLEECVAVTNSTMWEGLSLAPSFEENDWEHDLLSILRFDSVDVANIPTVDAVKPSTSFTTNTAAEPAQQLSLTDPEMVQAAGIFLRTHVQILPEVYVDGLARSMVRSFIDDGKEFVRNIPDQMMRYFISLFGRKEWPNTLEHLYTWLLQPAAPIAGDGEHSKKPEAKSGKKRSNPSSANNEKKKKRPYRCPHCGQKKVSWNGTIRIPHTCPKLQIKNQGTEMQSGIEGSHHDIDGVLQDTPPNYTVLYASHPAVFCGPVESGNNNEGDDVSDHDRKPAVVNGNDNGNDNDGDGDQKPAAIVRQNTVTASASTASSRSMRASNRQVRPALVFCLVVVLRLSVSVHVCMIFVALALPRFIDRTGSVPWSLFLVLSFFGPRQSKRWQRERRRRRGPRDCWQQPQKKRR
jgi:hypothetical protein